MGAWGEAVFENDVAEDWVDQLASSGTVHFLTRPLRTVIKAGPGEVLEADQCAEALAAAETLAAGMGFPCGGLPDAVTSWLSEKQFTPGPKHIDLARQAVERIGTESELKDLWSGDVAWKASINRLLKKLGNKPKPLSKPTRDKRVTKQQKSSKSEGAAGVPLKTIRQIAKRRGGLAMIEGKPFHLGLENPTLKELTAVAACEPLRHLERISLTGRTVTDRGLLCIAQLRNLNQVELEKTNISNAGIVCLKLLPKLDDLRIEKAAIDDESLKAIAEFNALTELRLFHVPITDAGLKYLSKITSLKTLVIFDSGVTAAALRRLERKLGCHIRSDCLR